MAEDTSKVKERTTGCPISPVHCKLGFNQSVGGMDSDSGIVRTRINSDVDLPQHREGGEPRLSHMVYVLSMRGQPLMPTTPQKAKKLLREGKAKVVKRNPFTIHLEYATGETKQPITLGVSAGYRTVGFSAVCDSKELIGGEVTLRMDISKKLAQRAQYRRTRRSRLWHRRPRNRKKGEGWLAPSIRHKMDSHIRLVEQMHRILPISDIIVQVSKFDIQKIKNPDIKGREYQEGETKGFYNVREYVIHRDNHKCQQCKGKSGDKILQVHHVHGKMEGATDRPEELLTVCVTCHDKHHKGIITIPDKEIRRFKPETFMSTVNWKIVEKLRERFENENVSHTFGYITKSRRIDAKIEKSHVNDAFVIATGIGQNRCQPYNVIQVRRNNRCIQNNRKGHPPSIRRQRYTNQPHDLVRYRNRLYTSGGSTGYGRYIYLKINGKNTPVNVKNITLIKHRKGFSYE